MTRVKRTTEEKIELANRVDELRSNGQGIGAACSVAGIVSSQYYAWKKLDACNTAVKPTAAKKPESDDVDKLIDDLIIQTGLDVLYEKWRQRALKLLDSGVPSAKKAGALIDELLVELSAELGWDLSDE